MHVNLKLLFGLLLVAANTFGQVQIRGLSFWDAPALQIYQIDNHFSKQKIWLQTVRPDTMGIFNTQLELKTIQTIQICAENKCALLYTQPNTRYIIELPQTESATYNEQQEDVELLFYQLDTNDINYRILGFENWMDNYIADIYQLKDIRSQEFILKVLSFKAQTAAIYGQDSTAFLRDYIRYSIGLTIDNFSVVGGPSKDDKYNFYLQTDSVDFSQPKHIEYARMFYDKYETQVDTKTRFEIESAIYAGQSNNLVRVLQKDPYIYSLQWAEFVALQLLIEFEQNKRIDKALLLELLKSLSKEGRQAGLKSAAAYYWLEKNLLQNGQTVDKSYLENELNLRIVPNKYLYLHHYIPANQKCIAEMTALKRLAKRYEDKLQIITFYPSEQIWTNADLKAFEGATWQKYAFSKSHGIWQLLSWSSAPAYILLDSKLKVLELDALGPLPNARTQTIDLVLSQLFNN